MADLKPLSDLAKSVWQVLVDRHSGAENAVPRDKLYRYVASWDEYRTARNGKPISFRAFRNAKFELVRHRYRVGSGPKGWYRIVTAAEARSSAAFIAAQVQSLMGEKYMLEQAAYELEIQATINPEAGRQEELALKGGK